MAAKTSSIRLTGIDKRKMDLLSRQARHRGTTPEKYLMQLLEDQLEISELAKHKTLSELLGPGLDKPLDVDALDQEIEEIRDELHKKKLKNKKK